MATTTLLPYQPLTAGESIQAYTARVQQIPVLSEDEERALWRRFSEDHDIEAARQLVLSHLRFVVRIAKGYRGYGLNQADLIQEGNVGLMKAVKHFDPGQGVRLVTFAVHWIKAEIHEFVVRHWRIVKIATTKAQRKLFFNLRRLRPRFHWMTTEERATVAETLGVSPTEVSAMEQRLSGVDVAFDASTDQATGISFTPADYLANENSDPATQVVEAEWSEYTQSSLSAALRQLDARSLDIIQQRFLQTPKVGLKALAEKYQVSMERIRQLEGQALARLRHALPESLVTASKPHKKDRH